jgi:polyisoprenyl-teichoic acid--peptidoglycan teichoic acid transferase
VLVGVIGVTTAASFGFWASRVVSGLDRVPGLDAALTPESGGAMNVLLVGSDSRAGADPNDPDFGSMGSEGDTGGRRSDTIMVLRVDRSGGQTLLLSLPRDLYVDIAGTDRTRRINAAFNDGPEVLVRTVQENFAIPIHHYVEIDFQGFKRVVDAMGGVTICVPTPVRDSATGIAIEVPGCHLLDGTQSLAYARSRKLESEIDGEWVVDGRSDIGRIERQQAFLRAAASRAAAEATNPLVLSEIVDAIATSTLVDPGLDRGDMGVLAAAGRAMSSGSLETFTFPGDPETIGEAAVLVPLMDQAEAEFLTRFR